MLPTRIIYYGRDEPLPEQLPLCAGPLLLVYEEGDLRHIRLGEREILRRIYVAVRDCTWGTVLPRFSNVKKEISSDSFHITYEVANQRGEIDFFWRGTITGDKQGTITFVMDGEARSTFRKNRIGFCVLHPICGCAGQSCRVEHIDGSVETSQFPYHISPHQPFVDLRSISHEVAPGVSAEVGFEGEIFETEDQRNWTDASYKTYCPPLRLPFPAEIKAGTHISQSITLRLKGTVPVTPSETASDGILFTIGPGAPVPLPRIGLGIGSHRRPLSPRALTRLRALNLAYLRVDLRLALPDHNNQLRRATMEAGELRVPLEAAVFLSQEAEEELRRLRALVNQLKPAIARWLIFHVGEKSTAEKWVNLARQSLAGCDPRAKMGAGSNTYFAELNRGRPPVRVLDLVSYSINPQVHAFDNTSLVENLAAQASTVESARQFAGKVPIAVSPVTLKPRFNPNATGPEPEPAPGELPSQVDVRQMSLFGAGWTLGSLKHLAESGIYGVTYYETTGWRGVMETDQGSPLPEKFRSLPGAVFPLYHVLADASEFTGGEVVPSTSGAPLAVDGLVLRRKGRTRILLANLTDKDQRVRIHGAEPLKPARVKRLDETCAESAMTLPEVFRAQVGERLEAGHDGLEVPLRPYAVARIDAE
jgi:hypothetical protein